MASKTFKGSYVEKRHNIYFAVYYVPKDVRDIIGKTKFYQSTRTGNIKLAEERANALVLNWKLEVNAARLRGYDPFILSAMDLSRQYKDPHNSSMKDAIEEIIEAETDKIKRERGDWDSDVFSCIAKEHQKPLKEYLPGWRQEQLNKGLKHKTIDQMESDIEFAVKHLPVVGHMTEVKVGIFIDKVLSNNDLSASCVTRVIGSCRSFFKYLQKINEIPKEASNPFVVPEEYKISKKPNSKNPNKRVSWTPFTKNEVEAIYRAALIGGDRDLANLIMIGAYTGARIEEICSVTLNDIDLEENKIIITDAKTRAGNRETPIHTKLLGKIQEMKAYSQDGYLISGLTFNKYNDRSNAIGKRFGRLKKAMGFPDDKVFHSIRKTVTTALENASVPEGITADILGHEKPTITYGLYSGGATLEVKREALEKLSYNF